MTNGSWGTCRMLANGLRGSSHGDEYLWAMGPGFTFRHQNRTDRREDRQLSRTTFPRSRYLRQKQVLSMLSLSVAHLFRCCYSPFSSILQW